ncbi:hypothetical protein PPL_00788 [Heterostelium album PN500]|uniref:Uncharacterized protein n=1 Tax=Heterostelium pallidum (strain ATCC 26659 / Pp 5 / PN500) TaxID=670386 RepID=D3AXF7_HETP5|nr:hypothetical protein PPL_00788 [Heterostelium album PN500]EFA86226.1 hypothetical protein PPL_00788 [Heterostelium album PN500]|eukprot:XP_020438331.1 hypothetical protein PPL_00788 [Heterostelium album PN500]
MGLSFSFLIILLLSIFLSLRIDSTGAQPTILSCTEINFTSISLTTGELFQSYFIERPHIVHSLYNCIGNDYYVLERGPDNYQTGYFNISILNGETGTFTTKARFYLPEDPDFVYQYNSIDLPNGLAFATYCPSNMSILTIFDMNSQTAETITTENSCELYAFGAYDTTNQLYYLYGFQTGTLSSLSFGVYSMITKKFTYYEIPFQMQHWSYVQNIFVYQSTVIFIEKLDCLEYSMSLNIMFGVEMKSGPNHIDFVTTYSKFFVLSKDHMLFLVCIIVLEMTIMS